MKYILCIISLSLLLTGCTSDRQKLDSRIAYTKFHYEEQTDIENEVAWQKALYNRFKNIKADQLQGKCILINALLVNDPQRGKILILPWLADPSDFEGVTITLKNGKKLTILFKDFEKEFFHGEAKKVVVFSWIFNLNDYTYSIDDYEGSTVSLQSKSNVSNTVKIVIADETKKGLIPVVTADGSKLVVTYSPSE